MPAGRTLACLFLCAIFVMVVSPAADATPPKTSRRPPISVLGGTTTLKVAGSQGSDTASGSFTLLNRGRSAARIGVAFQAGSSQTPTVSGFAPKRVAAGKARLIEVTFAGLASLDGTAIGQLVVTGARAPVAQSVEVVPAIQPSVPWPEILLGGSFLLAAVLMVAVIFGMPGNDRSPLSNPAPGPKWSFSSWATTLTGLGGVLGIVLTQVTFPPFPAEMSKEEMVSLSALFSILVVLAPFIFQALRKTGLSEDDEHDGRIGTNRTLLLSSTVTLWAVAGQLGVFGMLCWEILGRGTVAWFAIAALVLIGALALRYYHVTMSAAVLRDWGAAAAKKRAGKRGRPFDVSELDSVYLRSMEAPLATFTSHPEQRTAEVTVAAPPGAQTPASWSLL